MRSSVSVAWYERPAVYWSITAVFSALAAWSLSAYIAPLVFDPGRAEGFFEGLIALLHTIGPYAVFVGGIAGFIWYNAAISKNHDARDYLLSAASSLGGSIAAGLVIFLLIISVVVIGVVLALFALYIAVKIHEFFERHS